MKETILEGHGLCKAFPGGGELFHGLDVSVFAGDFTVIMGPSGAGKSTLLYTLSGMDSISGGTVDYKGQPVTGLPENKMSELWAKEFGFVFQQTHLVSNLTLLENVTVAGYLAGKEHTYIMKIQENVESMAAVMLFLQQTTGKTERHTHFCIPLEPVFTRDCGGRVHFTDEPTGALNRQSSREVLDLLTELNQGGQSILMVTHDMGAAVRGSRILYLEDGRILDELTLSPYEKPDKEREERANTWLSSLRW